jgi:hypothetical protein
MKALSDRIGQSIGASGQPLFANVYLLYVFDLWAERCRRREPRDARAPRSAALQNSASSRRKPAPNESHFSVDIANHLGNRILGGIEIKCPSSIRLSFCAASLRNSSPYTCAVPRRASIEGSNNLEMLLERLSELC